MINMDYSFTIPAIKDVIENNKYWYYLFLRRFLIKPIFLGWYGGYLNSVNFSPNQPKFFSSTG
jgi:hypothetical protein